MNKKIRVFSLLLTLMMPFLVFITPASASLSIVPLMGLFEGRARYIDVSLVNTSDKRQSYEIKWTFQKMQEGTGYYEPVDKSVTDWDLTKHLVFTPKRVSLGPSEAQKVRLALRLNGEPPAPGDYRGHLEFSQVVEKQPEPSGPLVVDGKEAKSFAVGVNVSFSIPIIYRVGESNAQAKIGDVTTQVNPNSGVIEAVVNISKNESPYGMLGFVQVFYGDTKIGEVRNGNMFPEIKQRKFVIPLTAKNLTGGSLRVVYRHYDLQNKTIFDEKTIQISK